MDGRFSTDPIYFHLPRQRISVACQRCRRRKIRCSGRLDPQGKCLGCIKANHPCEFVSRHRHRTFDYSSPQSPYPKPVDFQSPSLFTERVENSPTSFTQESPIPLGVPVNSPCGFSQDPVMTLLQRQQEQQQMQLELRLLTQSIARQNQYMQNLGWTQPTQIPNEKEKFDISPTMLSLQAYQSALMGEKDGLPSADFSEKMSLFDQLTPTNIPFMSDTE
ncbi:hypothetical protein SJAG_05234 [Schizosaccharomyces japonicus yFS275]|uniref:Zn(2)-C6 fungal-type domain-containing protein n=1 Tax=Schizosaccharomyces japonicus (strain yFS275 / FY16936) TaxID=402676 RepID=B6JXX8_SCHJY|nr:hypothetical protein SJAG_05234 [Schizosaccharomyces japonicus yFS275]EEB06396.1 hypothetical protein SJAG_05234 [Schizosaccharomyces japonicus yFS275]